MRLRLAFMFYITASPLLAQGFGPFELVATSVVRLHIEGETADGKKVDQYATGFLASKDGHIATSYHRILKKESQGSEIDWKLGADGKPVRKISVERWGTNKTLEPSMAAVSYVNGNALYDVAILRMQGANYTSAKCVRSIAKHLLNPNMPLMSIGFRENKAAYEIALGILSPADVMLGDRHVLSTFTFDMANGRSFHGGPVFNGDGAIVGILTSGQQGEMPPSSTSAIVTDIDWVIKLLPNSADSSECSNAPESAKTPSLEQCVQSGMKALRGGRLLFTKRGKAENIGGDGAPEKAEATVNFDAPDRTEIIPQTLRVTEEQAIGEGGYDFPAMTREDGRVTKVLVKLWVYKSKLLFGPPARYEIKLEGALQPILDASAEQQVRDICTRSGHN